MKTPETLFYDLEELFATDDIIEFIDNVQKEAYNQAIKDAAQKVTCDHSFDCVDNNEKSILKLLEI